MEFGRVNHNRVVRNLLLIVVFAAILGARPVCAQEKAILPPSPFDVTPEAWVVPDAYLDKQEEMVSSQEAATPDTPLPEAPPILLDPPGLPGAVSWRQISELDTSEESDPTSPFSFDEQNTPWVAWESLQSEDVWGAPFAKTAIRFSFLPNPDVRSIPDQRIARSKTALSKPKPSTTSPVKMAAESCAAQELKKVRERQLEAAESDRRTLLALREAMKELGLSGKLSPILDAAESVPQSVQAASKTLSP